MGQNELIVEILAAHKIGVRFTNISNVKIFFFFFYIYILLTINLFLLKLIKLPYDKRCLMCWHENFSLMYLYLTC